jgi:protein-disulfide isomerase
MSSDQGMSKRQLRRARMRRSQTRTRLLTLSGVIGVALCLAAVLIYPNIRPAPEVIPITPQTYPMVEANSMGEPNAPVSLDVWEDFQCPACKTWSDRTKPLLIASYIETGKVHFTFHFFPFIDDGRGTESDHAANAAMCAADQGRFWDYHDILFVNWNGENQGAFSDRRLNAFADSLGLDTGAFGACFAEKPYDDMIQQDMKDGQALGVSSTPTIIIDGKIVQNPDGANLVPQYDHIAAAIEAALAEAGQ